METPHAELTHPPLALRIYPDRILSRKSAPVQAFDDALQRFIGDMIALMENKGVGLSAPQVGVLQRIVVVEADDAVTCLVNPRIALRSGIEKMEEGCLSLPGRRYLVERSKEINIRARTPLGKKISLKANGLLSRILQHEIDHLDGVLICDKGTPVPEETEAKST